MGKHDRRNFLLDNLVLTLVPRMAGHGGFDEREALPVLSSGGAGPVQYYASALELDAAVAAAQIAGARAAVGFRSSFETFKVAFVDDPDGNQWELRFDSSLKLKNGALVLPD